MKKFIKKYAKELPLIHVHYKVYLGFIDPNTGFDKYASRKYMTESKFIAEPYKLTVGNLLINENCL